MSDRLPAGPPFDRPIFASAAATTRASAPSKMIQGAIRKATRSATHVVLRAIWGGMRKSTKVFHFAGLRRSGNHACINWLVNSIYGSSVEYRQLDHYLFREFPEGRVFLINSYAQEPALSVFRYVWKYRRKIARCEYLFLSLEDEPPSFTHFLRPKDNTPGVVNIHIDRTVFNLLSSRAKKIALSLGSTETLFVRPNNIWLRADKPAFDDTLLIVKSTSKKAVNLTVNNGVTVAGFMGFANFNFSGGGDFGISESPDGMTCPNSVTVTGFDHHYVNSRMRNCNCSRQYLYSDSDVGFADNDAGYDAGIPLGSWTATALCDSAEGGLLKFYAAMR